MHFSGSGWMEDSAREILYPLMPLSVRGRAVNGIIRCCNRSGAAVRRELSAVAVACGTSEWRIVITSASG